METPLKPKWSRGCILPRKRVTSGPRRQLRSPVLTSLMSSAELWQPCTMLLVQWERSLLISALKTCVSIPCLVPVRVAKDRSTPAWGDPFPGPEWTNLFRERKRYHQSVNYLIHWTRHLVKAPKLVTCSLSFWSETQGSVVPLCSPEFSAIPSRWWSEIKKFPRTVHLLEYAVPLNNVTLTTVRQTPLCSLIQKERELSTWKRRQLK